MEFLGRIFPLISAYDISEAIRTGDPTKFFEGLSRLPLGLGTSSLWQIAAGAFDEHEGIDYSPFLEDIVVGGRYIESAYSNRENK